MHIILPKMLVRGMIVVKQEAPLLYSKQEKDEKGEILLTVRSKYISEQASCQELNSAREEMCDEAFSGLWMRFEQGRDSLTGSTIL